MDILNECLHNIHIALSDGNEFRENFGFPQLQKPDLIESRSFVMLWLC